jgi:ClpP class serine protease
MDFSLIIWLIIILNIFIPFYRQRSVLIRRLRKIREFEVKRHSRVIVMIHRQESLSFLGLPISKYINIEDSEQVLRAIRFTPDDMPIDIILHTPGGLVLASEQIANAIAKHPGKVSVFIPHYAMSGGTMLALAADEIHMDDNAVLGPVDPQLGEYPAVSILRVLEQKDRNEIDDRTLILADMAEKAMKQVQQEVYKILKQNHDEDKAMELSKVFTEGRWTHDYPITCEELNGMGLNINCSLPKEIYELMELYPQSEQRRPSVQYIPLPYDVPKKAIEK